MNTMRLRSANKTEDAAVDDGRVAPGAAGDHGPVTDQEPEAEDVCEGDHCGAKPPVHNISLMNNIEQNHLPANSMNAQQAPRNALKPHNKWVILGLKLASGTLVLMYFIIPAIIKSNPWIMSEIAFLHRVRWPPFINLSRPEELGMTHTRSFNINHENIVLGAWHTLPSALWNESEESLDYEKQLSIGAPIILYLHGNAGTRAAWHRMQLYKVLSQTGFHIIALDYRGFADSSSVSPSEDGVTADAMAAFKYIKQHSEDSPIYIWGHSLGSGVATKAAKLICDEGIPFSGLVLEAPFNNMIEASTHHPLSKPFKYMPWFTWGIIEAMQYNNIYFASDKSIVDVTVPTLILHARDDGIVPYKLGRKLYEKALISKEKGGVQFVTFDGDHDYGHKHMHKAPELPQIVRDFTMGKKYTAKP